MSRLSLEELSFPEMSTIILAILKWFGIITWDWVWVLSPLWVALGMVLVIIIIASILRIIMD